MENIQETLKKLPQEPGVYLFRNKDHRIVYIGKAKDLSRRIKQYFQRHDAPEKKTARLVSETAFIETIPTTSEFDAILLESKLIRRFLPKYNVISRDDTSPLYVVLTLSEELPRVVLVRKKGAGSFEKQEKNSIFGPFQSGHVLRQIIRQLRTIVPYCMQKERRGKACFYSHLGLCDPCPAKIVGMTGIKKKRATRRYRKNLFRLRALFNGKTRWLIYEYEKEMRKYAQVQDFEQARHVRERIRILNSLSSYRYNPQVFLDYGASDIYTIELNELKEMLQRFYPEITTLSRIECFDVSHLFGKYAAASMVVLHDGKVDKREYRKFRIRTVQQISDVAMLQEALVRRFTNSEWAHPNLLLVDGGKPQVTIACLVLSDTHLTIPVVGIAKREEELILKTKDAGFVTLRLPLSGRAIKVVQRIRDEAHRFAIGYHKKLRDATFLDTM